MREKDWELFFQLVEKIVKADGTWKQKTQEVLEKASSYGADADFEELVGWFQE